MTLLGGTALALAATEPGLAAVAARAALLANDYDPDGGPVTFEGFAAHPYLTDLGNGLFRFEPAANDNGSFTRTVDMHVAKLRQKIEDRPAEPSFIVTVHRVGYRFTG